MTEHDDHLTPEERFFRTENIKYFKSFADLPDSEWSRIDDRLSLQDFTRPGEEGTSTALDFYREAFGTCFAVVPTSMPVDPEIKTLLYDVYIDEKQLFPEIDDDNPNVVDIGIYADIVHNKRIMAGLQEIFDSIGTGIVVEDKFDIPDDWELRRQGISIIAALSEIAIFTVHERPWGIVPLREAGSDKMIHDRVMLFLGPRTRVAEQIRVDESTRRSLGRNFRLILGEGGRDIDK